MAFWTTKALGPLAQSESSGNPATPPYNIAHPGANSRASGLYGFQPGTWKTFAPQAGVDTSLYPEAYLAPADVQTKVAAVTPISNWTCADCNATAVQLAADPSNVTADPVPGGLSIEMIDNTAQDFGGGGTLTDNTTQGTDAGTNETIATQEGDPAGMPVFGATISPKAGGGLAYHPNPNIQTSIEANIGKPSLIPDVANAINNTGKYVGKSINAGFDAVGSTIGAYVNKTIASAEAYAGRGFVMFFAIIIFLAAAWLLVPRETKQQLVSTAAKAA